MAPQAIARGDGDPMLGLEAGTRFGIVGLRAAGSQGAVYDAWDATHANACVLKIVRCERHALGLVHDLFVREAELMRSAPPAVKPRATGGHEREPCFAFLAMDAAPGEAITRSGADDRAAAAVRAVAELHAAGVVHGDLKPAHMLFAAGRVTLIDFGSGARVGHPEAAARAATPAYAAPEREIAGPTPAADVYSLGCVLFEISTGARPFAGLSGRALAAAHETEPVSCDSVPPERSQAIRSALAKHAADRPSAAELLAMVT